MTSQVANNVNVDSAAARDMRQFNNTSQFDVDIDPNEGRTVGKSAAEAGVLANSREAEILQYLGVDLQTLESDQLKKTAKDVDDAIAAMLMLNMDLMAMLLALMDLCTKVINRTRRDNMAFEAQVTTAQCEKIIDMFEKKLEAIQVTCDATKKGALASMATCGVGMAFSIGGAVAGAAAVQGFGHGLSSMSQAVGTYVSAEDNMKA